LLLNSKITIKKRKNTAVVKTPYVSIIDDEQAYYFHSTVFYIPFRDEEQLFWGFNSPAAAYANKFTNLPQNYLSMINKVI
jgi:hypothetical protein